MKSINKFLVFPLLTFGLISCGGTKIYELKDYIIECPVKYHNGFNILQLSDTHFSLRCDRELHKNFIKETINQANEYLKEKRNEQVDLIVITGDLFTFASRQVAEEYFSFFDEQKIYWAVTFGNHDEQVFFPIDWLTNYLNNRYAKQLEGGSDKSYCLFKDLVNDDVYGYANYAIELKDENNDVKECLYVLDSNRYNYGEGFGYDYIHEDQINWYEKIVNYIGTEIQSLAFFHIPLFEYQEFYDKAISDLDKVEKECVFLNDEDGTMRNLSSESCSIPVKDTGLYKKMKELGSTRGVFVGHDHLCSAAVKNVKDDIALVYGVKSTYMVGVPKDKETGELQLGGQIIHINDVDDSAISDNFSIHQIIHRYEDL